MNATMTLRQRVGRAVYSQPLYRAFRTNYAVRAVLDFFPWPATLPDGTTRTVPRHLARLIGLWRTNPGLWSESRQVLDAYHGGDAIDVGAFHGWYSVLFASRAAAGDRLVSVEPDVRALPALHDTLAALASLSSAIMFALPVAVGDGSTLSPSFPYGEDGHPRFGSDTGEGVIGMTGITIDTLVRALGLRPTFVKIDVEGAEHFVLQGMLNTLREYQPTLMLELHPYWQPVGVAIEDLRALLVGNGYGATTLDVTDMAVRELWSPTRPTPAMS